MPRTADTPPTSASPSPTAVRDPGLELVLRPGTDVVLRGEGEVQLGTDERWSVVLTGLGEAELRWLRTAPGEPWRPDRRPADVAPERAEAILRTLHGAGFLVPPSNLRSATAPARGAGDVRVLSALRADGAGSRTLAARAERSVAVVGLGRLGASLAVGLATAGVGSLVLDDPTPVLASDVGLGAYRMRDVGTAREDAVRRAVSDVAPGARVAHRVRPDVVVVVERRAADPERVRRLVGEGVAHLSVVLREADVVVGPFVRPGLGPCLVCLDLHRADEDACWPQVARQLRAAARADARSGDEETTLAMAGAAVATSQVLAALDGVVPRTATACIEIAVPDAVPRLRAVEPHPGCGCVDLTRAGVGSVVPVVPSGAVPGVVPVVSVDTATTDRSGGRRRG